MTTPTQNDISGRITAVQKFMHITGMRWYHIAISIVLSLIISGANAIGLGLLVPLGRSVTTGNVSIQTGQPIIDNALLLFVNFAQGTQGDLARIFFILGSAIIGFNILAAIVGYVNSLFGRYLQGLYLYRLHTAVYDRYFHFGKLYFDRVSQGYSKKLLDYTTRIVELVKTSQDSLTNAARLFAYLAIMVWLSWKLLIFVLLIFPFLYIISRSIMRRVNTWWEESKEVSLDLGRESFNILSAMALVWSYSQENTARKKFARMNHRLRLVQFKAHAFGDLSAIIPRLFSLIILFAVILFISISLRDDPTQDITSYIVFLYVASQTMPLFKVFNQFWASVSEMAPPTREILRLFSDKQKHTVPSGTRTFPGLENSIEFRGLTFRYDNRPLLSDITFTIPRGKFVALVGPSGAGKSTIISLLMRFYDCPPQSILLDGLDIREFDIPSVRSHMAYVDQDAVLLNDTLRANIAYGRPEASDREIAKAIKLSHLEETVSRLPLGMETTVGDRGVQLSGGERQRVAIARALVKKSDIVLLDEATSALDTVTEKQVQAAVQTALRKKTAIVIAHRLSTITQADYIVYLEKGEILERGTFDELLAKKGHFYKQWQLQTFT